MKRALAAVALLAFLPSAHAQDKAKGEFNHSGEFRLRDTWNINPKANKDANPSSKNGLTERFKLDLGFKASEKLSANLTLLNNFQWGTDAGKLENTHDGSQGYGDFMTVNQAYASWMMSDDFNMKFGRMNYQIADGALMSVNDWEAVPYSFEGVLGNYEVEFGKFQAFAFKFRELNSGTVTASDAERNVYGINFDLKTMPEWLKGVNAHILKDNSDAVTGDTNPSTASKQDVGRDNLRYGAMGSFAFSIVDLKAWYEANSGKYHLIAPAKTDVTAGGNMMQVEVGATFASFMSSRVFVKWHKDSGQKDTTSTKNEQYDAYFHEQHCSAGCMDLFDWGNLTFIQVGATLKPMDNTEVGLSYWMFSKTEKGATAGTQTMGPGAAASTLGTGTNTDKSALGNEIDLWAEHKYTNSLATMIRVSQFMPGDVYKANSATQKDNITEVFLQGKMTF